MNPFFLTLLLVCGFAQAQSPAKVELSLEAYLNQVQTQNPEARSLREQVTKAQLRLDEADIPLSSSFYANYHLSDDKNEPTTLLMAKRMKNSGWRAGIKDPTSFGLTTDVFVESAHGEMFGVSPGFVMTDFEDSRAGVELTQSLWRNGFGSFTRANTDLQRSASRLELLKQQFDYKNLMLKAENAYWTLASLNQIVRLQEENTGRAKKLYDWMRKRVGMRLVDDVDGLQAQASYETRDLELQTSLDERAALKRQFNTLRGVPNDEVEAMAELPPAEIIFKGAKNYADQMTREDFKMVYEQAQMGEARARGAVSQIAPQLDITAGVATHGLDSSRARAMEEIRDLRNPTWQVGVVFSVPLDYSLIHNMNRSFSAEKKASEELKTYASFAEERTWHDLLAQKTEAQRRFERAVALEKTQTELVKRERSRLLNGRTTTFQTITMEQNLALSQIQRVRAQVGLVQIQNVLKNWEAK